jgi:hypothetical protein
MVSWVARLLLIAAGTVTSWFVARDEPNFSVIQLATALLLLTFVVAVLAFRPARWTVRRHRAGGPAPMQDPAPDGSVTGSSHGAGREQGGTRGPP